jgi:glutathione S-transferase
MENNDFPGGRGVNIRQRAALPGAFFVCAKDGKSLLKVWGRTTSVNVQKVMWTIAELGLPSTRIDAGGSFGKLDTPEFVALNPNRLIPVIEDGGFALWESGAIIRYLTRTYGSGSLMPADARDVARADQWIDWAASVLYPDIITNIFIGLVRTPAAQRNDAVIAQSIEGAGEKLQILNDVLGRHTYILGDTFTVADIPAGAMMFRYFALPIARPKLANVEAWYGRLSARSAYREHVMIDYSPLRVEKA